MIFKRLKNRTTTVLADKKNENGNQPKNENRVAVVNPNGNNTSISTRTSTSISRRHHGGGGGRYSNEKGGIRDESPATTAFVTATSTSMSMSTTNQMFYPVSPYDEMPHHIRPLVQKLVPPSSVRSKSFDSSPRRNSTCGQQPEEFRQDVDRRHRHHRYRTHQQQERQNDDSKRNETINTRVRERVVEVREGGGGGDEPRDRPPLSFNYHIQKIKNTNVSVVVSNLRRRTSIKMMTNGNKDGSNNSNDAHTVPFMIELPSSCLYLVSSEDYSDVTIDDADADARDQSVLMVQQHRLSYDDDDKLMKQWKEQIIWPSDEDRS